MVPQLGLVHLYESPWRLAVFIHFFHALYHHKLSIFFTVTVTKNSFFCREANIGKDQPISGASHAWYAAIRTVPCIRTDWGLRYQRSSSLQQPPFAQNSPHSQRSNWLMHSLCTVQEREKRSFFLERVQRSERYSACSQLILRWTCYLAISFFASGTSGFMYHLHDEPPDSDIHPKLLTGVPTKITTCGEVCPSLCTSSAGNEVARSDQSITSNRVPL